MMVHTVKQWYIYSFAYSFFHFNGILQRLVLFTMVLYFFKFLLQWLFQTMEIPVPVVSYIIPPNHHNMDTDVGDFDDENVGKFLGNLSKMIIELPTPIPLSQNLNLKLTVELIQISFEDPKLPSQHQHNRPLQYLMEHKTEMKTFVEINHSMLDNIYKKNFPAKELRLPNNLIKLITWYPRLGSDNIKFEVTSD